MGDSRFEFSTKFRFPEYMWHFSNIHKHIDFSIAKNANLPSKSHWDETWDFVSKFQKLKFCQKWLDLRQISSRYHLSTLEITSWSKNPKIFFKPLKALCNRAMKLAFSLIASSILPAFVTKAFSWEEGWKAKVVNCLNGKDLL